MQHCVGSARASTTPGYQNRTQIPYTHLLPHGRVVKGTVLTASPRNVRVRVAPAEVAVKVVRTGLNARFDHGVKPEAARAPESKDGGGRRLSSSGGGSGSEEEGAAPAPPVATDAMEEEGSGPPKKDVGVETMFFDYLIIGARPCRRRKVSLHCQCTLSPPFQQPGHGTTSPSVPTHDRTWTSRVCIWRCRSTWGSRGT